VEVLDWKEIKEKRGKETVPSFSKSNQLCF
jgi:hypothetical protein